MGRFDLLGQGGAKIARAVQEHVLFDCGHDLALDLWRVQTGDRLVAEQARQRPKRREREQAQAPVKKDDRSGKGHEPHHDGVVRDDEEAGERECLTEQRQLINTGMSPEVPIQAEMVEKDNLGWYRPVAR